MSKPLAIVSCPIDTYSGYGARSRDFVKALVKSKPEWDVKVLGQRWGNTRFGYLKDHNEVELNSILIPKLTIKPKVWFQITVPNEFQPIGEYNIGVTAGIETTVCAAPWVQGVNRMDLIITSAQHGKRVFENSVYEMQDDKIKEQFCFLFVGHWLQGDQYEDRKNVGGMIEEFLHTFKHTSVKPALIIKTQSGSSSILDRNKVCEKINAIKASIGQHNLPNIYLVHGELTDSQVNELYNHSKVKSMISLTKGEGFGRPLLEFTTTGKPLVASGWSGQLDFLDKELSLLVGGTLENVHQSAVVKDMLIPESKWFKYNSKEAREALKFVFKNYKKASRVSNKLATKNKKEFSLDKMTEKLGTILSTHVPFFPEKIDFKPVPPKVIKINKPSKK
jgi:glycosyltransferase involved in cell wall biosynthesis